MMYVVAVAGRGGLTDERRVSKGNDVLMIAQTDLHSGYDQMVNPKGNHSLVG